MADLEMGPLPRHSRQPAKPPPSESGTEYVPIPWRRLLLAPKYIPFHLLGILLAVATVLISLNHDKVVHALLPITEKIHALPAGWLIPIAVLIIISFPPLFGHELVAILCGIVYGLWPGFGVVAAGTFLGEIGTWFAFRRLFARRAARLERTNLNYGALARMTRDGGFPVVLVIRLSVVPSHFSTAVFATCDVKFWYFCVATFLTLPKQIVLVYLGVLFVNQQTGAVEKGLIFGVGGAATVVLGIWVWWRMGAVKKVLLAEQAERKRMESEGFAGVLGDAGTGMDTESVKSVEREVSDSDTASLVPLRMGERWEGSPTRR
jgi:uncharacterized membrane protein YdjX (TVP38/TMEM64 family)